MNGLVIAVGILTIIVCLFAMYIAILQKQLRNINRQLEKRLSSNTKQPVSLELINNELNQLTANINKCFKAEETLRLESVQKEKKFKELIANISHDLRTPLTAVKGYQQLMGNSNLSDEQRKKLEIAQKYTEELGQLIDHFFEYSYLVSTDLKVNKERINLTSLLIECLAASVASFEEQGLTLQFKEAPPIFVLTDQELTVRIVQNLIRNCVAHSAGDVMVLITASETAVISFKNPVENANEINVKRLFERFYTGDSARGKTTGLGLHIVKLLAEQVGGTVSAHLKDNELDIQVEFPLCS